MFHEHMGYGIIAKCISACLLKLNKTPFEISGNNSPTKGIQSIMGYVTYCI